MGKIYIRDSQSLAELNNSLEYSADSLLKISAALCVSADYLLTGDIVDKDLLILSDKMRQLSASQIRCVETIIDECIHLFTETNL